jgi:hypothetical protein
LSVVSVMCCQVEISDHSSREVLPTVARRCVWLRDLEHEEAKAPYRAVKIQSQWVVTPGKQTHYTFLPLNGWLGSISDVGSIFCLCQLYRKFSVPFITK